MELFELIQVTDEYVLIKFQDNVRTSTLINANFVLTKSDATPVSIIGGAFKTIHLAKDYRSLSRTLYLWWNVNLEANSEYTIAFSNIEDAVIGSVYATEVFIFDTQTVVTPNDEERPSRDPIAVQNYSIKDVATLNVGSISSGTPAAGAVKINYILPSNEHSFYLSPIENDGKIEVQFEIKPAANFINSDDFKLQRKPMASGPTKWQSVETVVRSNLKSVFIYLPSTDATPVYSFAASEDPERIYWEPKFKYRLTISKNIAY